MNKLNKDDFILVRSNASFSPYLSGPFFSAYAISPDNLNTPGTYKITFHYSTISTEIEDYLGDGNADKDLLELFSNVAHIELKSNTIEIEIIE